MSSLKLIENPARRKAANPKRRKRRNPTTATAAKKVANPRRRRRRNTSVARVSSPSPVARKIANGRRRRKTTAKRRRNGVTLKRVSNGLFGDTKGTVKAVGSLLGGLLVTNLVGSIGAPILARPLASVGLGGYAKPVTEVVSALTVNRWAGKMVAGNEGAKFAMIGGLAMAAMSFVQQLLPQTSTLNPFASPNLMPVVINQPTINANDAARLAGGGRGTLGRRPVFSSARF